MTKLSPPSLAVITIAKDEATELAETLSSILNQSCLPDQLIIVSRGIDSLPFDAKSMEVTWIKDKDSSLYDAMNIGLNHVTADGYMFLNGGDIFISRSAVTTIKSHLRVGFVLAYISHQSYYNQRWIRPNPYRYKDFLKYCGHQGVVFTSHFSHLRFDLSHGIAADIRYMSQVFTSASGIMIIKDHALVEFRLGGLSNSPSARSIKLRFRASIKQGIFECVKFLLHMSLGSHIAYRLLAWYRRFQPIGSEYSP
jgi:glycosyltransferase involved in cell wall biosynthesis